MSSVTVRTTTVFRQELGTGGRAAFTLLGVIVFALGLFLLLSGVYYGANGGSGYFAKGFLEWLVILALFLVGIVNIVSGALKAEGASTAMRAVRFAIGVVVIVLGIVAIWPVAFGTTIAGVSAFTFLWIIVAIAFTLEGIFLILVGLVPNIEGWQRALAIVLGLIVLIFGILSWAYPSFAFFVVWITFSIALLAFGIRYIITGISGVRVHKMAVEASS